MQVYEINIIFFVKKLNIKQLYYSPLTFLNRFTNMEKDPLNTVQKIINACIDSTAKTLVAHMAAERAHLLIGNPDGTSLFANKPDFTQAQYSTSCDLHNQSMINAHGDCPAPYVLSSPGKIGYEEWNMALNGLHRTLHPETPSLETMFHQSVDAQMASMEIEHTRLANYLVYRQKQNAVPEHANA
jgi:hypothetical protein